MIKKTVNIKLLFILLLSFIFLSACSNEEFSNRLSENLSNTSIVVNSTIDLTEESEPEVMIATEDEFEIIETNKENNFKTNESLIQTIPDNLNITDQWIAFGTNNNMTKNYNTSIFKITKLTISTSAEDAGYKANTAKDDIITFEITNQDDKEYYITYIKPKESNIYYGLKILINGHRVENIGDNCGSKYIKPNETLTCKNIYAVIKKGVNEMLDFQPYTNILSAESSFMESKVIFKIKD